MATATATATIRAAGKLTDFGVSTALDSAPVALAADLRQFACRPRSPWSAKKISRVPRGAVAAIRGMYRAPELFLGLHHASPKSDVFSLGVIAYELLTGERCRCVSRRRTPSAGRAAAHARRWRAGPPTASPAWASLLAACSAPPQRAPQRPDLLRALRGQRWRQRACHHAGGARR